MYGARGLWKYTDNCNLYQGFEKLVDFYHTTEFLSKTSEALFGKSTQEGVSWYDKWRTLLLEENNVVNAIVRLIKYYRDSNQFNHSQKRRYEISLNIFQK